VGGKPYTGRSKSAKTPIARINPLSALSDDELIEQARLLGVPVPTGF
jgi:hypothetical protein